jgi:hypothetical protein
MNRGRIGLISILATAIALMAAQGSAIAAPAPSWKVSSVAVPYNFAPGGTGEQFYETTAMNVGAAATDGSPVTVTQRLPSGVDVTDVQLKVRSSSPDPPGGEGGVADVGPTCGVESVDGRWTVRCVLREGIPETVEAARWLPGEQIQLVVFVSVPADLSGSLTNVATVEGGGAVQDSAEGVNEAGAAADSPGLAYFESSMTDDSGKIVTQAGARPYQLTTSFAVKTERGPPGGAPFVPAQGEVKEVRVALPAGLVGNPTAASFCKTEDFNRPSVVNSPAGGSNFRNDCPAGSVVGFVAINQLEGLRQLLYQPIYQLFPPKGMPAQFGFQVAGGPFYINTRVRTGGDYGIVAYLDNISQVKRVTATRVVFWGVPASPSHDPFRGRCLNEQPYKTDTVTIGSCPAGISPVPLLSAPTACEGPLSTGFLFSTWAAPASFAGATSGAPRPTGCQALDFSPSFEAVPRTTVADSPTGLRVNLHVPQNQSADDLATAHLRDAEVRLPEGVTINPSSATGLAGCDSAEIGLTSAPRAKPATFTASPPACPDASKIGSVKVSTPLLDHPIEGGVHVAKQGDNPFGSLIAIYIAAHDEQTGVALKLAGHVVPDPVTGRLTTRFENNPQLPFEDLDLVFFDGPRAPLRTPVTCGEYTTTTALKPWSAPFTGPDATPSDSFTVTAAPGGGACAAREADLPHAPAFVAGTEVPLGGDYSPFLLRVGREDGSQQLRQLRVTLPQGLTGKLAGIPYCPDAALAAAAARSGTAERQSASCSAASRVGEATVRVGAGSQPFRTTGSAYLSGPYKGAPLSLAVVMPAVAGPFDLGTVVVRSALQVDPTTAQITAVSDPLPTILEGIPLDLRSVEVALDRQGFTLNPTGCEPKEIGGAVVSLAGEPADVRTRFQVGGCKGLDFKPRLSLRLIGPTHRSAHPKLRAVLRARSGEANIGRATVTLPKTQFLENAHIRTICTRVQYAAQTCPSRSIYGYAKAWSPLLDRPLQGPVYLRSSNNPLPDLVASLDGQVHVDLVGRIDSVNGRIRNAFERVPDVPFSKFVLTMQGGKKGLLVNNTELCRTTPRATAKFVGHNGKVRKFTPVARPRCGKKQKAGGGGASR